MRPGKEIIKLTFFCHGLDIPARCYPLSQDGNKTVCESRVPCDFPRIQRGLESGQCVCREIFVRKTGEVLLVVPAEFFDINDRTALVNIRYLEQLSQLINGEDFLLSARIPSEKRDVINER